MLQPNKVTRKGILALVSAALLAALTMGCPPEKTYDIQEVRPPQNPWASISLSSTPPDAHAVSEAVEQNNRFASDVLDALKPGCNNIAFSPFGASQALALAAASSQGHSQDDLVYGLRVRGTNVTPQKIGKFGHLIRQSGNVSQSPHPGETAPRIPPVASRLNVWVNSQGSMWQQYPGILEDWFAADVERLEFSSPIASSQTINEWVQKTTSERMPGSINPETIYKRPPGIVISNTVTFRARWQCPFPPQSTQPHDFHLSDGATIQVPMMHASLSNTRHIKIEGFSLLDIPLESQTNLIMRVIFPPAAAQEKEALNKIVTGNINHWLDDFWNKKPDTTSIQLFLPRFQVRSTPNLTKAFGNMSFGGTLEDGNLSGTFEPHAPSNFALIIQDCAFDINEEGIDAPVDAQSAQAPDPVAPEPISPTTLCLDRPFCYQIINTQTRAILFVGIVADPRQDDPAPAPPATPIK
jgi:serpin B